MSDRERPKKSWREIDQSRDKSSSRGERREGGDLKSSAAAVAAAKSYRAALERAFANGTMAELAATLSRPADPKPDPKAPAAAAPPPPPPTAPAPAEPAPGAAAALPAAPPPAAADPERENRQKMLVKIKEAEGRDPISRAIDAFMKAYGKLPNDFEVLTKALSHKDDERVREAMAQIGDLLGREKPRRARALQAQLRFLEETHGDPDIRKHAAELRARL
jgi:hypothetical protein